MKAIVCTEYGSTEVLQLQNVEMPVPKDNEILVRMFATAVTAADTMMRKGKPYIGRLYLGFKRPNKPILGFEFAGIITEMGKNVSLFKTGDRVFGGTTALGCYGQYVCINENDLVATMSENVSYKEAAPVSGSGVTVLNFLKRMGKIKKNDKVLINGASGGLGTYAVQYAKHVGAQVTAVCSTANIEMVASLGADEIIDYTKNDFTKSGKKYDIIFDTVGKRSFSVCKSSLTKKGVYLSPVLNLPIFVQSVFTSFVGGRKAKFSFTGMLSVKERLTYFLELKELLERKTIKTILGREYQLSQIADAHQYVETGHKKGNVIINFNCLRVHKR